MPEIAVAQSPSGSLLQPFVFFSKVLHERSVHTILVTFMKFFVIKPPGSVSRRPSSDGMDGLSAVGLFTDILRRSGSKTAPATKIIVTDGYSA